MQHMDSYADRKAKIDLAVAQGLRQIEEGAHILDLGAESSRPGALPIAAQQEIDRLLESGQKSAAVYDQATTQLEEILDRTQPQLTTIICGDFNARAGNLTPELDTHHPPRMVSDIHVCPRAKWLLKCCTMY